MSKDASDGHEELDNSPRTIGRAQIDALYHSAVRGGGIKEPVFELVNLATYAVLALQRLYLEKDRSATAAGFEENAAVYDFVEMASIVTELVEMMYLTDTELMRRVVADRDTLPMLYSGLRQARSPNSSDPRANDCKKLWNMYRVDLGSNSPFKEHDDDTRGPGMKYDDLRGFIKHSYFHMEWIRSGPFRLGTLGEKFEKRIKRLPPPTRATCSKWASAMAEFAPMFLDNTPIHPIALMYKHTLSLSKYANFKRAGMRNAKKRIARLRGPSNGKVYLDDSLRKLHWESDQKNVNMRAELILRNAGTKAARKQLLKESIEDRLKTMLKS